MEIQTNEFCCGILEVGWFHERSPKTKEHFFNKLIDYYLNDLSYLDHENLVNPSVHGLIIASTNNNQQYMASFLKCLGFTGTTFKSYEDPKNKTITFWKKKGMWKEVKKAVKQAAKKELESRKENGRNW